MPPSTPAIVVAAVDVSITIDAVPGVARARKWEICAGVFETDTMSPSSVISFRSV